MAPGKLELTDGAPAEKEHAPPAYESAAPSQGTTAATASTVQANSPTHPNQGPTAETPFNFPADALPPYTPSPAPRRLIVIPQKSPEPISPFLKAYPPDILAHGIPSESWIAFLDTLSAFLAAKVSDRALSHAADVAKRFGEGPTNTVKGVYTHVKAVGKGIGQQARRGNVIGVAVGVIGGAITIPVSAAMGIVGTAVSLPGSAVAAVAKKPQTQRARAAAYLAVANRDWLHARGLDAALVTSEELSELTGTSVLALIATVQGKGETKSAQEQLATLEGHYAKLEISGSEPASLKVGKETLWVVLSPVEPVTEQKSSPVEAS
ncbi:hypothetical protein ACHAQA_004740 [Verticillium albo-atrum]